MDEQGKSNLKFHALHGPQHVLKRPFYDLVSEVKAEDPLRHSRSREKNLGIVFTGSYPAIERRDGKEDRLTIVSQVEVFPHQDAVRNILMKALADKLREGC